MPSWTLALVWKNVFINSSVGNGITGWFEAVTGICVPQWFVYGMFPCAIILGIHYAPFAYILVGGVLRNMEANLEEAATILKADRLRIIRKITLPIVLPSMISTLLLVFQAQWHHSQLRISLGLQVTSLFYPQCLKVCTSQIIQDKPML